MNRFIALVGLAAFILVVPALRAQEEQYVQVYNLIQEGDASANAETPVQALNKYLRAQTELQKFQKVYPDWNSRIVNFRLNYLAAKISDLSGRTPAVERTPAPPTRETVRPTPTPAPSQIQPANDIQSQLNMLREQIGQLQADNSLLQAKVKEAFTAQPATVDPRELVKAADKVKSVTKENELLKITLAQEKAAKAAVDPHEVERMKQQLADANRATAEQTERASTLIQEKLALQNQLLTLTAARNNTATTDALKKSLADASRKLTDQLQLTTQLQSEKTALQTRVTAMSVEVEAAEALRAENLLLKKQLTDLKLTTSQSADTTRKLAEAQAQIAALQSDKEVLRLEKIALQQQVKQLTLGNVAANRVAPEAAARVKKLESERDELQKKLSVAQDELASRKNRNATSQIDDLRGQLDVLRTRIAVYQAPAVPYSKDELDLFNNKPEQMSVSTKPGFEKKSTKELPTGAMSLVNEAQRDFALGRYEDAETKYLLVLRQDDKNVYTLANLAAIQLELNHLDESEKHVQQALALNAEDPYSLSILGNLKFRQGKYDDALDALAHAAKLDPKNAEVQNHLGLVLSQKGQRKEAETALRKSVELDPNYASAHNNLAVVYLTQRPPAPALARWHYQKARDLGMPANPQLEKLLDGAGSAQP
jgi:Flp pilus assembly protein TadD